MDSVVFKQILHGAGANVYGKGVIIIIIQLAGVPILLHYRGTRFYGEWLIPFATPSYLSMIDLGFSQSELFIATLPIQNWLHFPELSTSAMRWILWLLAAEVLIKLIDGPNSPVDG